MPYDVAHHELDAGGRCRRSRPRVDDQRLKFRRRGNALRQRQPAVAHSTPPVVDLPARQTGTARHIRYMHPGHQAFRDDPRLLIIRALTASARTLDHIQSTDIAGAADVQMEVHFDVSLPIHTPPSKTEVSSHGQKLKGRRGTAERLPIEYRQTATAPRA